MRVRACWILAVALGLAAPMPALAQAPSPASDLFHLGRKAFDRGDYPRALELFRESNRQSPGLGKLANIARTEARLGLLGSAMRHFQEVADKLSATNPLRAAIAKEVGDIGSRVPHLHVSLASGVPPGTTVAVDGEPLLPALLGKDIPVDPGKHVVIATAPGGKEQRYEVAVGEGRQSAVDLELTPDPPSPKAPVVARVGPLFAPVPPPARPRRVSPLVWAGFGVGGAGIVAGAITGGISWAKTSALKARCKDQTCPPDQGGALTTARALATASNVTFGMGAASVVVGIVGLVLPKPKAVSTVGVSPIVGPGEIGVQGAF